MNWLDWCVMGLGIFLIFEGLRAIARGRVKTDLGRFEGSKAGLVGWIWIAVGLLLFFGAITDVAWLDTFVEAVMQAA
ncbi:MAG: hypothetical protein BWY87_00150 [Deltaproteobacteria bacterium ADurb.Bin510]|jgi:hypothetical protein|nr:MAG: hypothetical protein BWY87_00150 [Deltaproteobacteria bacterium ADurb.Bin510]